jgi:hypothetical protein
MIGTEKISMRQMIKKILIAFLIFLWFTFTAVFFIAMGFGPIFRKPTEAEISRLHIQLPETRARWEAHGIQDYSIEVDYMGAFHSCDAKLIVRGGELVDVEAHVRPIDPTKLYKEYSHSPIPTDAWVDAWTAPPRCQSYAKLTISAILERIGQRLEIANPENDLFRIKFDPYWGFITSYEYIAHSGFGLWAMFSVADGWENYQVSDFQPLPPQ